MRFTFNKHLAHEGLHAPFSPSSSSWLRYDNKKAVDYYANKKAAERGSILHAWAKQTIDLGIKQPDNGTTLSSYINDAIGFGMNTEVVLYFSDRFFGTADAISFKYIEGRGFLRIHDLKTGVTPAHMEQLLVYAALFCLEYKIKPGEIDIELRLYQNDEVLYCKPTAEDILPIMDKIIHLNKLIDKTYYKEA